MKVDLNYLRNMSAGNIELVAEMINIFTNQVNEFVNEMEANYASGEFEKLGKLAHKAKSSISIMGLNDLAADLKKLETIAKQGIEQEKYRDYIDRFIQETGEAVQELKEIKENLDIYF